MGLLDIFGAWKYPIILIALGAVLLTTNLWSYNHGKKVESASWLERENKALIDATRQREAYNEVIRLSLSEHQKELKRIQAGKDKRDAEIPGVSDGNICFASWDAVRMWDAAMSGGDGPVLDTGRVPDSAGPAPVTDEDILYNVNENGRRWKECRDKITWIRDFQEKLRAQQKDK